mmetsp:Transcript_10261/g.33910  ORF Transcript_10261/g.33910 Transcript_10261/m.33910 type:complete len:372 (-) Transcript_10261:986-2101(-)
MAAAAADAAAGQGALVQAVLLPAEPGRRALLAAGQAAAAAATARASTRRSPIERRRLGRPRGHSVLRRAAERRGVGPLFAAGLPGRRNGLGPDGHGHRQPRLPCGRGRTHCGRHARHGSLCSRGSAQARLAPRQQAGVAGRPARMAGRRPAGRAPLRPHRHRALRRAVHAAVPDDGARGRARLAARHGPVGAHLGAAQRERPLSHSIGACEPIHPWGHARPAHRLQPGASCKRRRAGGPADRALELAPAESRLSPGLPFADAPPRRSRHRPTSRGGGAERRRRSRVAPRPRQLHGLRGPQEAARLLLLLLGQPPRPARPGRALPHPPLLAARSHAHRRLAAARRANERRDAGRVRVAPVGSLRRRAGSRRL